MLARQNLLLHALSADAFKALEPELKLVILKKGTDLTAPHHRRKAYFPVTSVIAMHARVGAMPDTYLCFAGVEGCAGLSERLTAPGLHYAPIVCGTGYALAISRDKFMQQVLPKHEELGVRLRSTSMVAQLGLINANCAATHSSSQRVARLLVEARNVWPVDEPVCLSQKELADLISVRRETVTHVIKDLEKAGLLAARRGQMEIIDLPGLRASACDCSDATLQAKKLWVDEWRAIQSRHGSAAAENEPPPWETATVHAGGGGDSVLLVRMTPR
jgi:hypothetical protein